MLQWELRATGYWCRTWNLPVVENHQKTDAEHMENHKVERRQVCLHFLGRVPLRRVEKTQELIVRFECFRSVLSQNIWGNDLFF